MLGTSATLTPADDATKPYFAATAFPAEGKARIKVEITKLWQAGDSKAVLQQDSSKVAELRASKYRVPFNIKSGTPSGKKPHCPG
jgi:hypothetical protein